MCSDLLGLELVGKFDDGRDLLIPSFASRLPDFPREQLIQLTARLLEEEAKSVAWHRLLLAGVNDVQAIKANLVRCIPNPMNRGGPNRARTSEDAVDGGHADAGS